MSNRRPLVLAFSLFLLPLMLIVAHGCRTGDESTSPEPEPQREKGIFIVNEGAFPNPGTVSFYNITRDSLLHPVIGTAAGWVTPNDARVVGGKAYIVVNGSDKIEVLNAETFQRLKTIVFPAGTTPGFMEVLDSTKAFTANYNGTVSRIDLLRDSLIQTSSPVVTFPGGIESAGGEIYLSDIGFYPNYKNIVKVLNASSLAVVDSITVGVAPGMIVAGASGRIHLVCGGAYPSPGTIYTIDIVTHGVADSVGVGVGPSDIGYMNQSLYVLHSDRVMKLSTAPLGVTDSAFVALSNGLYFYSLQTIPSQETVCLAKITSAGGTGQVELYTRTGTLKRQPMPVGFFPGAFAMKE